MILSIEILGVARLFPTVPAVKGIVGRRLEIGEWFEKQVSILLRIFERIRQWNLGEWRGV